MTDDEIIAVVQAHKEGKQIQVEHGPWDGYTYCEWGNYNGVSWNFCKYRYRVAPEPRKPREWYVEIPLDGSVGQVFTDSRQLTKGGELVKVREVIE